jgi:hypothetical protein
MKLPIWSTAARTHPLELNPIPLKEIGVRRWQYDYWYKIIEAALLGRPDWHPAFQSPAAIRYAATSPQLLSCGVARWNTGRPYEEQIRPFGFLLAFMPRIGLLAPISETVVDTPRPGRPAKTETLAPIAPMTAIQRGRYRRSSIV